MKTISQFLFVVFCLFTGLNSSHAQCDGAAQNKQLRVCVAGLVHGHAAGFMDNVLRRNDIKIVGIAEADTAVADEYRRRYHLEEVGIFGSLENML